MKSFGFREDYKTSISMEKELQYIENHVKDYISLAKVVMK